MQAIAIQLCSQIRVPSSIFATQLHWHTDCKNIGVNLHLLRLTPALALLACAAPSAPQSSNVIGPPASPPQLPVDISGGEYAAAPLMTADGWKIRFTHVYVHVRAAKLQADPEKFAENGADVWEDLSVAPGPFLVDLVRQGERKGHAGGTSRELLVFKGLSKKENAPLDPGTRYGFSFGFELAGNRPSLRRECDSESESDCKEIESQKWATLFVGEAERREGCHDDHVAFLDVPKKVHFRLGFKEFQHNLNCENLLLPAVDGHHSRGVSPGTDIRAEATYLVHQLFHAADGNAGRPRFDAFAAAAKQHGHGSATEPLVSEDLRGFAYAPVVLNGASLPERTCGGGAVTPLALSTSQNAIDGTLPPSDLYEYTALRQATAGRMNGNGECGAHSEASHTK